MDKKYRMDYQSILVLPNLWRNSLKSMGEIPLYELWSCTVLSHLFSVRIKFSWSYLKPILLAAIINGYTQFSVRPIHSIITLTCIMLLSIRQFMEKGGVVKCYCWWIDSGIKGALLELSSMLRFNEIIQLSAYVIFLKIYLHLSPSGTRLILQVCQPPASS